MSFNAKHALLLLPLALVACSSMPSGPNVTVLPGSGKTLEQFQADDFFCRQYASMQIGTNANEVSVNSGVKTAALGTALGAASGAMIDGGHGARCRCRCRTVAWRRYRCKCRKCHRLRSPDSLRQRLPTMHVCKRKQYSCHDQLFPDRKYRELAQTG